ncbi:serine/threonine protein kinase [Myxococcus fulvus]|uniref:Serine/threonine protein kinase n=1 Tax=Myxococcus fulvus TaxID=33 RepID=A0A511SV60_MYXFU|nr:serine/threonine-protein kinase [Myxococcus fulvus]GEN05427.1 hypothetical protein MFU01_04640 [Myxococcus fulvus]SET07392.1 serine/threonine protein kinase [Myxococcus fulvus]
MCPREVFRAGVAAGAGAYRSESRDDTDEATFKRGRQTKTELVRPLVAKAPAGDMTWEDSVTRDVLVGTKVGDYLIKRRIGHGGMGIVYEGEHAVIGRKVAVKVIRPDYVEGGRARDLATEARSAAAIRHRGIIDIFGFGTIPDVGQYLVMEYLDGAPLDEVLLQRAPMLEVEVIRILDALLSALGAAHGVGVIHRDLKPGNVFLVREGDGSESVKVLDFGIAKRSEAPYGSTPQTHANALVGTPEYIAPEQACGQQVSPQTDLYAVGVMAFEMLTKRLPFEGESAMGIVLQHVRTPPPPVSRYREVNASLAALVARLLEKEPSARPASAEAVRRELKGILAGFSEGATRLAMAPLQAPPKAKVARKEQRARMPERRAPVADSDQRTNVEAPTMLLEQTALDHRTVRPRRSRKWWMGGALALVLVVGGWAFLSQARAASARRESAPVLVSEARGTGTVVLKVSGPPLMEVLVNGKSHGERYVLELPEGIHRLEVRGRDAETTYSGSLEIHAGAFIEHHVTL